MKLKDFKEWAASLPEEGDIYWKESRYSRGIVIDTLEKPSPTFPDLA